ncbi:hypothetical protein E2C01_011179 [Portunus trituberculatus]|uniref:Uncharacterized protein n=1 Tax=Portunus trituberculatus TaxID=210409 RepID=A0A5B7DAF6_PORTR|nr:hypothetical protein [Portunus trituberculatus]
MVFTAEDDFTEPNRTLDCQELQEIAVHKEDIGRLLKKLEVRNAMGPDDILPEYSVNKILHCSMGKMNNVCTQATVQSSRGGACQLPQAYKKQSKKPHDGEKKKHSEVALPCLCCGNASPRADLQSGNIMPITKVHT